MSQDMLVDTTYGMCVLYDLSERKVEPKFACYCSGPGYRRLTAIETHQGLDAWYPRPSVC